MKIALCEYQKLTFYLKKDHIISYRYYVYTNM